MRQRIVWGLALVFTLLLSAAPAVAHHAFAAEFDAAKPVTLRGYITKIEWVNPHNWFYINVKNEDGKITNWGFETGSPSSLQKQGWTRTTLKIGDEVIVNGSLARNGSNRMNATTVVMAATGQKLGAASSQGADK